MYDKCSYLRPGYKGLVTMSELSGGGGLKMYVCCKEQMMTDNNDTILYPIKDWNIHFTSQSKAYFFSTLIHRRLKYL
jgi:hypothetical protein